MIILNPKLLELEKNPVINIDSSLMVTKKAVRESYTSACNIPTPAGTRTHLPVDNRSFINMTANKIEDMGWDIVASTFASSFEQGNCHFVFEVSNELMPGIHMQVAGHNSHIKMRSLILYLQTRTVACTNMDVPCEIPLQRKHTNKIVSELPFLIGEALIKLQSEAGKHIERIGQYKSQSIDDLDAHDIMIQSIQDEVIPASYIPTVIKEWHNPIHEDFEARNLYSLYNCFTESFKKSRADIPYRTQKIMHLLNNYVSHADDELVPF
tara:strand:- start:581 stop:1381 length:801 start_codon:yes stop_codon:yes gene_type:complete